MITYLGRPLSVVTAIAIVAGLSACSAAAPDPAPPAPKVASAASSSTGRAAESRCERVLVGSVSAAAVAKFGATRIHDAHCFTYDFALTRGFTDLMRTKTGRTPADFAFLQPSLTPSLYASLGVDKAIAGDQTASGNVNALTAFAMEDKTYRFDRAVLPVRNVTLTPMTTTLVGTASATRLKVNFRVTADVIYRRTTDNKLVDMSYSRDTNFLLKASPGTSSGWLIDNATGWLTQAEPMRVIG